MDVKRLVEAGTGRSPCDLNMVNCTLVDLLRGEFRKGVTVSVKDGFVVGLNDGLEALQTVDLGGLYLAPSLVDAHMHVESSMLIPAEYARLVAPLGTGTVVADPHEIVNVLGYDGMRYMLSASADLPLDMYFMVPSCVPATGFDTAGAAFHASDMHQFLNDPRVLGLGEVMNYPGVLANDPELHDKLALFRSAGKPIDGHAPGLGGAALSAYIAAGIGSDHECATAEEAREKIGKGMYVMIREGSTTRDLKNLLPAIDRGTASRILLCSDDRHPDDLVDEGNLDNSLRILLASGVDPIDAFRIACRNPAEWFRIPGAGAVAPGYRADFVVFDSLADFRAKQVYKRGKLVAENGRLVSSCAAAVPEIRDSVNVKWLSEEDFKIPVEGKRVRVIDARPDSVVTGSFLAEPKTEEVFCVSDTARDLLKIFVMERHKGSGNIGKGFIHGLGLKRGAIGGTVSHDSHNMIIAGVDDISIFKAARHLNKIRGGFVFAVGDEIVLDLPLPIAGLMSDREAEFVIERIRAFNEIFAREGLSNPTPLMTLSFMGLPVIPSLKITDRGLVDVEAFARVSLWAD